MFIPLSGKWGGYGGKGKGKGAKGMQSGKGQMVAPFPPMAVGPPVTRAWRGPGSKRALKRMKDAQIAHSLYGSGVEVSESEGDSSIQFRDHFAASRHFNRQAQEAATCPEAAAAFEQHAALQYQQGLAAMPPSQLVTHLEGRLKGKIAEADRLKKQISEATSRLQTISREGWDLQRQLEQAKAKALAANASLTLPAATAEAPDMDALIGAMIQMQGLLPPELTSGFGACVRHIQKITSNPAVDGNEITAMEADGLLSPTCAAVAVGPAPATPLAVASSPAACAGVGNAAPDARPLQPFPSFAQSARALVSNFGPLGAATRGRAIDPITRVGPYDGGDEKEPEEVMAVRSKSHPPGVRAKGEAPSATHADKSEAVAGDFLRNGKMYFSQEMERAGFHV